MKRLFHRHFAPLAVFLLLFGVFAFSSTPAGAVGTCTIDCQKTEQKSWETTNQQITQHMTAEMTGLRSWLIQIFWEDNLLPAMMLMADQLSATAMLQMEMVGAMFDAKHQLETQQLLQKIAARTHKDYHPSIGLCEFGSGAKSLAASERKAEVNAVVMSQRSQDRSLGAVGTSAAIGEDSDKQSRVKQFREKFCDPADNNNGLTYLCDHDQAGAGTVVGASRFNTATPPAATGPAHDRKNKDIDYTRTIDAPWTLDVDFVSTVVDPTDGTVPASTLTDNEEEIIALASNLYGHKAFIRPPSKSLEAQPGHRFTNMQKIYLDMRSVIAKRAVAENSFNAITAMKSEGTPGSRDYLVAMMRELGVAPADAAQLLGDNPSYYAQMEILTKKIYQNPDFYTNLYDKPANVQRKNVALQAIGLMQKFDLFKSHLRHEASMSILLELAVMDLQGEVENEINQMTSEGTQAR